MLMQEQMAAQQAQQAALMQQQAALMQQQGQQAMQNMPPEEMEMIASALEGVQG